MIFYYTHIKLFSVLTLRLMIPLNWYFDIFRVGEYFYIDGIVLKFYSVMSCWCVFVDSLIINPHTLKVSIFIKNFTAVFFDILQPLNSD